MMMLLLVSAVTLLVSPAAIEPKHIPANNLNSIIDLVEKYNESFPKDVFVNDVSHLAGGSGKCRDKFFCKVHEILRSSKVHEILHSHKKLEEVKRNLDAFVKGQNFKCEGMRHGMNSTGTTIPLPTLLDHLVQCSRHRNLLGPNKSIE